MLKNINLNKYTMTHFENVEDNLNFSEPREFGDLISAPFNYFFKNFKGIILPMLKFAAPIIAVGILFLGFAVSALIKQGFDFYGDSFDSIRYYVSYIFISVTLIGFGYIMALAVIYSYASLYHQKGVGNITDSDVKELAFSVYFNLVLAQIVKMFIIIGGFLLLIVGAIYFSIALTYVDFIIVHKKASVFDAISESFKVTKGNWWKTFGVLTLVQIILSFALNILSIPIMLVGGISGFIGSSEEIIAGIVIVFGLITFILTIIVYSIPNIGIVYLYFNIETNQDNPDLLNRINSISRENTPTGRMKEF